MKVNKVQQGGPILFVAKDKPGQFLIMRKALPRTHGNYRQASFHHAHMIRVRYFDNLCHTLASHALECCIMFTLHQKLEMGICETLRIILK